MDVLRRKLFSVTMKDCRMETFTVGGHGGAGKDTSNTGVRIIHLASGAVGKSSDERSQLANKRAAFARMANTKVFKAWARQHTSKILGREVQIERDLETAMHPRNLKIEGKENGKWIVIA